MDLHSETNKRQKRRTHKEINNNNFKHGISFNENNVLRSASIICKKPITNWKVLKCFEPFSNHRRDNETDFYPIKAH